MLNEWTLPAAGGVTVVLLLVVLFRLVRKRRGTPYYLRPSLFGPGERTFLEVLDQAVGARYRIFGKIGLTELVGVHKRGLRGRREYLQEQIRNRHFAFLLCEPADLSAVCAVEIDDDARLGRRERKERAFIDGLCADIGLPLARIPVRDSHDAATVAGAIQSAVLAGITTETGMRTQPVSAKRSPEAPGKRTPETPGKRTPEASGKSPQKGEAESAAVRDAPHCPKCGATMRPMKVKRDKRPDHRFWGCSGYPECRGIVPMK